MFWLLIFFVQDQQEVLKLDLTRWSSLLKMKCRDIIIGKLRLDLVILVVIVQLPSPTWRQHNTCSTVVCQFVYFLQLHYLFTVKLLFLTIYHPTRVTYILRYDSLLVVYRRNRWDVVVGHRQHFYKRYICIHWSNFDQTWHEASHYRPLPSYGTTTQSIR